MFFKIKSLTHVAIFYVLCYDLFIKYCMGDFMSFDGLIGIIEGAHWVTLFLWLMLAVVFAPINRESIILFMGVLASVETIAPAYAFFISFMATYVGYSLGFFLAKLIKKLLLEKPSKVIQKRIKTCNNLLECYGVHAIIISYFIPGARHFLPVILGLGVMSLVKFLSISFIGAKIWTAVFFFPAYLLGENWNFVIRHIFEQNIFLILITMLMLLAVAAYLLYKNIKKKKLYRA